MEEIGRLHELDRRRTEVRQFLQASGSIQWYICKQLSAGDSIQQAFALYYLSGLLRRNFGGKAMAEAAKIALGKIESTIRLNDATITKPQFRIHELPNVYATAVLIAGYIRECRRNPSSSVPDDIATKIDRWIAWLQGQIVRPDGFIARLNPISERKPSSFLTFWCAAALCESKIWRGEEPPDLCSLILWSGRRLRDMIAWHHGGLRSQVDPVEMAYAAATILLAGERNDNRILAQHAVSLLFDAYSNSGCLEPSAPVLSEQEGVSVQVSTAEVLATILVADNSTGMIYGQLDRLRETWDWLRDHGSPEKGWYPEGQARANIENPYASAAVTLLLSKYEEILGERLNHEARADLGIAGFVEDATLESINLPGDLEGLLAETLFSPLERSRPELASFSMILYGPPGTSKTTVAKLVSHKLKWPLLLLGTGRFSHKGRAGIATEAAELFERLKYVKQCVVLFDELEELVKKREEGDPESRLLTTAMLPLIQELRDRREVVFILATNHVKSIDSAVSRLGRFDIVRCILPPPENERERILDKLVEDFALSQNLRETIRKVSVLQQSKNFCYGDLQALVRELAFAQDRNEVDRKTVARIFQDSKKRALKDDDLADYKKTMKDADRPLYRGEPRSRRRVALSRNQSSERIRRAKRTTGPSSSR